jgi:uncharacterized metal-binding protein
MSGLPWVKGLQPWQKMAVQKAQHEPPRGPLLVLLMLNCLLLLLLLCWQVMLQDLDLQWIVVGSDQHNQPAQYACMLACQQNMVQ